MIPFLISTFAIVIVLFFVVLTYLHLDRQRADYAERLSLMPAAVQWERLSAEVQYLQETREPLLSEAAVLKDVVTRADFCRDWLHENESRYEKMRVELDGSEVRLKQVQREDERVSSHAAEQKTLLQSLEVQHHDRTVAVNKVRQEFEGLSQLEKRIKSWLQENEPRHDQILRELPGHEEKLRRLREDVVATSSELANRRESLETALRDETVAQSEAEQYRQESQRHKESGEQLRLLVDTLETESSTRRDEIDRLRVEKHGLELELIELQQQAEFDSESLAAVKRTLDEGQKEVRRREDTLRDLETSCQDRRDNLQNMERQNERLDQERKNIELLIAAAEKRWSQIAPTIGVAEGQRLAELWSPALRKGQFRKKQAITKDAELSCLQSLQEHLIANGLHYHERVIHQFHTSLKVADMSPLVVLAGISGTGKSELPRRYAEGMGMHALTLPVQPRWDSPQDMFGFYNYLENRYRATELARALVQMDRFVKDRITECEWNPPKEWIEHSLSDRMLIVLLDEMNLARVEYYFSEFLSRLETRRGLDPTKRDERAKAEIQLEVGMQFSKKADGKDQRAQQPTLPIFVDRNVLFVGTMNEDETTQTLSDKVVDRANVLRFGRPKTLKSRTTDEASTGATDFLSYRDWQSWIREPEGTLGTDVKLQVSAWVHKINDAMQRIGRPFAYRTYGAVLSYVANYPQPDQYRFAVADQIEMKILPKLRGLDPNETAVGQAISEIQSVVNELGDQQLEAAIREARSVDSHQFLWHGVDRMQES